MELRSFVGSLITPPPNSFRDKAFKQTDRHDVLLTCSFIHIVQRTRTRVLTHSLKIRGQKFIIFFFSFLLPTTTRKYSKSYVVIILCGNTVLFNECTVTVVALFTYFNRNMSAIFYVRTATNLALLC